MTYSDKYFEYYQTLYNGDVPLDFTNQPLDNNYGWIPAEGNWTPREEGPRHKDDYPCRFRLSNTPSDAPQLGSPGYLEYWTKLYNDPAIDIGLYSTSGSILPLDREYPPEHFLKYIAFFIIDDVTGKPRTDTKTPEKIKAANAKVVIPTANFSDISVSNGTFEAVNAMASCYADNDMVATKDYVNEQIAQTLQVPSSVLDQTPFNEEKEPTMANEKITIEIDAKCIKPVKEVKPKTAFQEKESLLVRYYSVTGSLYANREFSGKNALKKAKALLRAPDFAGCTMVPYTIGKMVRVKIDLEEV